ncbi:MAG: hypothetical protein HND48_12975 [Chloroflexi bacterium]|nr:hypothetical protein [Chloroflexota bacterium]
MPEMRVVLANGEEMITGITQYNAIFRVMTAFHAVRAGDRPVSGSGAAHGRARRVDRGYVVG